MRMRPVSETCSRSGECRASSTAAMMLRPRPRKREPSAVRRTPPGCLSNRETPSVVSSCLIAIVTADCETFNSLAAIDIWPASAAAMK